LETFWGMLVSTRQVWWSWILRDLHRVLLLRWKGRVIHTYTGWLMALIMRTDFKIVFFFPWVSTSTLVEAVFCLGWFYLVLGSWSFGVAWLFYCIYFFFRFCSLLLFVLVSMFYALLGWSSSVDGGCRGDIWKATFLLQFFSIFYGNRLSERCTLHMRERKSRDPIYFLSRSSLSPKPFFHSCLP